jgi:hypothetical protein
MKRFWVVFSFSLVFTALFLGNALAVVPHPCSTANESILSLYDYINSHGALWNDTMGTPIEVCYDEIFGVSYTVAHPTEDVHACLSGNANRVLTLAPRITILSFMSILPVACAHQTAGIHHVLFPLILRLVGACLCKTSFISCTTGQFR